MNSLLRYAQSFCNRNASTILTCVGGIGVVATAVLAVKATPKALERIKLATEETSEPLSKWETVKVAGPAYIPAAITGVSTIACIFGANILNKRQQAALMSAYALLDESYKGYRAKVDALYGEGTDKHIREELARGNYIGDIDIEDDQLLFYDELSNRYFNTTIEEVLISEYEINRRLAKNRHACLNDFYDLLEIDAVDGGDCLVWSTSTRWIEFEHTKVTMDDGMECYIVTILTKPYTGY